MSIKKVVSKKDQKAEFLKELVDRYAYWSKQGNKEYADAYQHIICAFTTPTQATEKSK